MSKNGAGEEAYGLHRKLDMKKGNEETGRNDTEKPECRRRFLPVK